LSQIGHQHGSQACKQVQGSIAFYSDFFKRRTGKTESDIREVARQFLPYLQKACPAYLEEIRGLADGAGVEFETILALNVRTEIGYGLLNDGCTAFAWKTKTNSFIAQNWDWDVEQANNIIRLKIVQVGKPTIHMMTEGGIIGKIGLNSAGVGVTLNAISARGVAFDKLPCHLALRSALESTSLQEARTKLTRVGVASACHITVADIQEGNIGFENTAFDQVELQMVNGINTHSNHLIKTHATDDKDMLADSPVRLDRVRELLKDIGEDPSMTQLRDVLKDEKSAPCSINRSTMEKSSLATLFSIVMDLGNGHAVVKMGRPTENGEEVELRP
jgi:isopenicillin-N N-acyltransferase-like protein